MKTWSDTDTGIAIIGVAGRFPQAESVEQFWNNLVSGVLSIRRLSPTELDAVGVPGWLYSRRDYVPCAARLPHPNWFDARFFHMSSADAGILDPQIRLLLECSWTALENAGYGAVAGQRVGVYAGTSINGHMLPLLARTSSANYEERMQTVIHNEKDYVATRLSYLLDLRGPSITVQSACSTSLVAVHLACDALLGGECDMALAGAATVRTSLEAGYVHAEGSILSADGECRPFDARASGTVFSNGVGVVVLKRLEDAINDNDPIWAIIRGTAINNDGASKVGYYAPSFDGQIDVIRAALAMANLPISSIDVIEAHGTGTQVGDAIELAALAEIFRDRASPCLLGSLKRNVGHLDAAAGVAGLIKAACMVRFGIVPPTPQFVGRANWPTETLSVNTQRLRWDAPVRRAGVSAFGVGGTNAHAILEQPPVRKKSARAPGPRLFCLSARSATALDALAARYVAKLERDDDALADICYTNLVGRAHFEHRLALVASSTAELHERLQSVRHNAMDQAESQRFAKPRVAFVFGNHEAPDVGVSAALYDTHPTFRDVVQRCDHFHIRTFGRSILDVAPGGTGAGNGKIATTELATYAIQCGFVALLHRWGIRPEIVFGHGVGGYAAGYAASVYTLEEGARLVIARTSCLRDLPGNADAFDRSATEITFNKPTAAFVSDVTGERLPDGFTPDADYWRRHLREHGHLPEALRTLSNIGPEVVIDIGMGSMLTNHVANAGSRTRVVPTLRAGSNDASTPLRALGELYLAGVGADWKAVAEDYPGQRVALPTYVFESTPCDPKISIGKHLDSDKRNVAHAVLGKRVPSALEQEQYLSVISSTEPEYLSDHIVEGAVILPATAYLDTVAAVMSSRSKYWMLQNFELVAPMRFGASARRVQTILYPPDASVSPPARSVEFYSQEIGEDGKEQDPWVLHARGSVIEEPPVAAAISAPDVTTYEEVDIEALYGKLEYGPSFRLLHKLYRKVETDGYRGVGHLIVPRWASQGCAAIHPVVLDTCMQVVRAAAIGLDDTVYIPAVIDRFRIFGTAVPGDECTIVASTAGSKHGGKVELLGPNGERLASFQFRATALTRTSPDAMLARAFHEVRWQNTQRPGRRTVADGYWVVLAAGSFGQMLCEEIRERGLRAELIDTHSWLQEPAQVASTEKCQGIIQVLETDGESAGETMFEQAVRQNADVLGVMQSLVKQEFDKRFVLVTRGAQVTHSSNEQRVAIDAAGAWTIVASATAEYPSVRSLCIDLGFARSSHADEIIRVVDECLSDETEDRIAFRNDERLVPRIAHSNRTRQALSKAESFRLETARAGELDQLHWATTNRRPPAANEVEIETRYAAMNFRDVLNALGLYPGGPEPLGAECAGIVRRVGAQVIRCAPGDRVVAIAPGAMARFVCASEDLVYRVPDGVEMADAATVCICYFTALYALKHVGRVGRGSRVLIHAGAGGVGHAAIHVARSLGAEIYASAGSEEKRAYLRTLGVAHVIDSRHADFVDEIMTATQGAGLDAILNSLTGPFIRSGLAVLRPGGRFVEIGKSEILKPDQVPDGIHYRAFDLNDVRLQEPEAFQAVSTEVWARVADGGWPTLPRTVFPHEQAVDAFRHLARGQNIGKVILALDSPDKAPVRRDGTYVVSGGTGALGRAAASWLAQKGAGRIVLLGRSIAKAEPVTEDTDGTEILLCPCDVTDRAAVERAIGEFASNESPIRGVIHAAGVLQDAALLEQNGATIRDVMAPKLLGAWNLRHATRHQPLDFFVMYSSITGVLGKAGQANYASANAAMTAFAHDLRRVGTPASVIHWGPWAGGGMAMRDPNLRQRLEATGLEYLPTEVGQAILESVLASGARETLAILADWARLARQDSSHKSLIKDLVDTQPAREIAASGSEWIGATKEELARKITVDFTAMVRQTLGLAESQQLSDTLSFAELGVDSLTAAELRHRLSRAVGYRVPALLLTDMPTISAVAHHLAEQLTAKQRLQRHDIIVPLRPTGSLPPLFCLHPVGGDVDVYAPLIELLPPEIPVYGLRTRADTADDEHTTLAAMAAHYSRTIRALRPSGPYRLLGWSFGGTLAHEIAGQLEREGGIVDFLGLIDSVPNGARISTADHRTHALYSALGERARGIAPSEIQQRFAILGDEATAEHPLQQILETLIEERYVPATINTKMVYARFALALHHSSLLKHHTSGSVSADIYAWTAHASAIDPSIWKNRTRGILHGTVLKGDHISVIRPPTVNQIAQTIQTVLRDVAAVAEANH